MIYKQLLKELHTTFSIKLEGCGFIPESLLSFSKSKSEICNLINLPSRRGGTDVLLHCLLGLRFEQIRDKWEKVKYGLDFSAVSCPIHWLHQDRVFYEWKVASKSEIEQVTDAVLQQIYDLAVPFFDRFATIDAIKCELMDNPVSKAFIAPPIHRISLLAAILLTSNQRDQAEELLSSAIEGRQKLTEVEKKRVREMKPLMLSAFT